MLLASVCIGLFVAAFTLGWLNGYTKACHAHGWKLPKFDWG